MTTERPIPLRVRFSAGLWRLTSADGRLSGAFTDRKSARRWVAEMLDVHTDYALQIPFPDSSRRFVPR